MRCKKTRYLDGAGFLFMLFLPLKTLFAARFAAAKPAVLTLYLNAGLERVLEGQLKA